MVTVFYLLSLSNAVICFRILGYNLAEEALQKNPLSRAPTFLLSTSCFSAFTILLFGIAAVYVQRIDSKAILSNALYLYGVVGAFLALAEVNLIPHASSNATMMALSLPFLMPEQRKEYLKWFFVSVILLAILSANTSSPIGVSCVVIASYLWMTGRKKFVALSAIPLVSAILLYGVRKLFDDTDRFRAYKTFMGYWWNDSWSNVIFGYGPGSFEILSQIIQEKLMFMMWFTPEGVLKGYLWMHLHSDLLQFLFEYGVIGFLLILACAVKLFRDLEGPKEKAVLLGCLSAFIFDFACRYPGAPMVLLLLFGISRRRNLGQTQT